MTEKEVQKAAGKKFSKEQRDRLGLNSWVNAHEDLLLELMRNPDKLAACEHICRIGQSKKPEK